MTTTSDDPNRDRGFDWLSFDQAVDRELSRARAAHGPIVSPHEGYAVILEEIRELERDIFNRDKPWADAAKELLQVAAMCRRMVEDLRWLPFIRERERQKGWP